MRYRRLYVKGGQYFFTLNLANRNSSLLTDKIDILWRAMSKTKANHPFDIIAMVVLPDHLHTIWQLPENDDDFSTRWGLIKSNFSKQINKFEPINQSRLSKGERGIWQRRFWEHKIRNQEDRNQHIQYIHMNPVKHGYCKQPTDWPYSSIHQHILDYQGRIN